MIDLDPERERRALRLLEEAEAADERYREMVAWAQSLPISHWRSAAGSWKAKPPYNVIVEIAPDDDTVYSFTTASGAEAKYPHGTVVLNGRAYE